ncbi:hypothetical protein C8Q74DRAFT_1195155 [Fomes fomentarius]|nr:hypothetical protein C8Q74DRAFT_1195155 [Fomes fomentarius]
MDEVVTKRIHISGLTPAITAKDLSDRLMSFGTVKSIDGFGVLDAVGQPRKFAYATMETTKGKLARCMNLLSGVTWKGAKLRLGEAKADYRERIAKEHADLKRAAEEAEDAPPSKKRRGVQGVHARDMSLVTPENVSTRGGWRVTPSGRLIRPMRMRPTHPLPEPLDVAKADKGKSKGKSKSESEKKKKRIRDPPTRARRKTIDPTRWGSQHLKGIFLENAAPYIPTRSLQTLVVARGGKASSESDSEESEESEGETDDSDAIQEFPRSTSEVAITDSARPAVPVTIQKPSGATSTASHDLVEEKNQSLGLLRSLFGDKQEWGGSESVGSDIEEDVQREALSSMPVEVTAPAVAEVTESAMEVDEPHPEEVPSPRQDSASVVPTVPTTEGSKTKLKDLFAPRAEDAGFSLLGHLDLDLELDDDIPFEVSAPVPVSTESRSLASVQPPVTHTPHVASLDPSRPFFFPGDHTGAKRRAFDPTNWRTWFYRTDSPEAIRARWEETKGELTAGWKRRHREAIKSRRRRGGGMGEVD